jgi:hypothetical protein
VSYITRETKQIQYPGIGGKKGAFHTANLTFFTFFRLSRFRSRNTAHTPPSQLPESALPITLVMDLTPLEQALRSTMPERFSEDGHPLRNDYRWDFVREGVPQLSIRDGLVTIQASYTGDIEGRTAARGCRLDPVYPVLETTGQLDVRQDGAFLVLGLKNPQTTIDLKAGSETKCNMFKHPGEGPTGGTVASRGVDPGRQTCRR